MLDEYIYLILRLVILLLQLQLHSDVLYSLDVMTTLLVDRYAQLSIGHARSYVQRSMNRILDALPVNADRDAAEERIHDLYVVNGQNFLDAYKNLFVTHLQEQFEAKTANRDSLCVVFSGAFGSGKTSLQKTLDEGAAPTHLNGVEAVRLYKLANPFCFDFRWAWLASGLYNESNHQGTFPFARAAGSGAKDAAMELAIEYGLDLLYPSSLTPHVSDGSATLNNEIERLQGYQDQGYKLVIIGCAATVDVCLQRVALRDRKPTEAEVIKSVEGFNQHYRIFSNIADSSVLLDTGFDKADYSILTSEVLS
jgi:hypothetical protein